MEKTNFDEIVDRRGTFCTQWDYIEDRFGVADLLPFTISDMDFKVPYPISNSLKERMSHEIYGYTRWNHEQYKEAITKWFEERFNSKSKTDWIVYSPSVMYSISKFIEMKSDINDQVLIQTPAYDAFFKTIKNNQRQVIENKLVFEDGQYTIDFDDLEKKLAQESTKIFLFCSPHNPTGRVWSLEELKKVIMLCNQHRVFLISDEIHMDIVRKKYKHHPITSITNDLENIILCSSTSKTFNTAGLVGSYLLIPNEENKEEFLDTLKNRDGLSSASIMGVESTIAAYTKCEKWVDELNDYISENMLLIHSYLKRYIPEMIFVIPESTFLAWIDTSRLPFSMKEIQGALITVGKLAIMDGGVYGEAGESFLRMNVGCPKGKVLEGLEGLRKSIDFLKKK